MDIQDKIEEIIAKIKSDPDFAAKFKADPVAALEKILGIDLPEGQINAIIDGVKAKIGLDQAGDLLGKVKNLF
ncbi:MAG: hypothetical protein PHI41_07030 [Erysipelotrichaceae bacterium]|nr:hypothetical protein [Erysipelotrichaceae bacterium]MDD3810085.1 hypothetical protein [Erysipelotrichaceae bacterium]